MPQASAESWNWVSHLSPLDESKLHPETMQAMSESGWTPDRCIAVDAPLGELEQMGFTFAPYVRAVIANMYGLKIEPASEEGGEFGNYEPLIIRPEIIRRHRSVAEFIDAELGGTFAPIGLWLSSSYVFLESGGRAVGYLDGLIWQLGESFEAALNLMVRADKPLECVYVRPGRRPWPPPRP
ncbi:SUKH-3 domain-containing protein [Streptomyces sp. DSM 41527]|uniref:SUKH-3 domain-containing protein n=1 Tax=Streptomyces mooreae TaxID=3075523 RepID=A0ABU2T937_9ACTN|nr:SUKH-3 domain-containing protein [Streptomyces sp. DSM 41527]MDT0457437.1 SUKH-3 domain-containing protein [Streptomyces sp. DSM 41527]